MPPPRNQRRKEDRPDEIADAAFEEFAEHGFERTRIDAVARRAGVSKGLMYLYFKTKEELFKAVITRIVSPRLNALLEDIHRSDAGAEALLKGPVRTFMRRLPDSPARVVLKLLISEGARHPDLLEHYWENVASRGMATITAIVARGVETGEFRRTAVAEMPQLVISPMIVAVVWKIVFQERELDTNRLIDVHIDMLLDYLRAEPE